MENKTYIGDGVYASWDGYQIWLETKRPVLMRYGFLTEETHRIALDYRTFDALYHYGLSHFALKSEDDK